MSIQFDFDREKRIGIPEAIFCQGKDPKMLNDSLSLLLKKRIGYFLTRLTQDTFNLLDKKIQNRMDYHRISQSTFLNWTKKSKEPKGIIPLVSIVTGGTADSQVAWEAKRTLDFMNIHSELIIDVGVAGLWRLQDRLSEI